MKRLMLLLFALSLILITTAAASFTNEWGEYQDDASNRGFVHDETGHFTSIETQWSTTNGMSYQPLIANVTGNSDKEIIIYSGNYLQLYDNELRLLDEINIGFPLQSQPTLYKPEHNNITYIAFVANNNLTIYDGELIKITNISLNITSGGNATGVRYKNDYLYVITRSSATTNRYYKINTSFTIINNSLITSGKIKGIPAISDIDNDGIDEIGYVCDPDNNGELGLCIVDSNTGILDISFSTDGKIDNIADGLIISSPVFYNLNGAGYEEIIIYSKDATGQDYAQVDVFKSDGTNYGAFPKSTGYAGATSVSTPIITDFGASGSCTNYYFYGGGACTSITDRSECINEKNIFGQRLCEWNPSEADICVITSRATTSSEPMARRLTCFKSDGSTRFNYNNSGGLVTPFEFPIIAADANGDGIDEIISSFGIFNSSGSLILNFANLSLSSNYPAIADVTGDNEFEIIMTNATRTVLLYSSFINAPPTVNNTIDNGGFFGWPNPVCNGTVITFQAQECGGSADCNYDNDGSEDEERIATNCGIGADGTSIESHLTNLDYGNYTGSNPEFDCYYNHTGYMTVRLFLQDEFNDDDFSEYNENLISFNVIAGVPGITCNIAESYVEEPSDNEDESTTAAEQATNDAIDDSFGLLFGTGASSDKLKLIVGLAIVIAIIIWAAQQGVHSGQALLGIGIITTLMVTFIGLLTPAIIILVIAALLLIIILGKAIGSGSDAGGV